MSLIKFMRAMAIGCAWDMLILMLLQFSRNMQQIELFNKREGENSLY